MTTIVDELWTIQAKAAVAARIILNRAARPMLVNTEILSAHDREIVREFADSVEKTFRLREAEVAAGISLNVADEVLDVIRYISGDFNIPNADVPLWMYRGIECLRKICGGDNSRPERLLKTGWGLCRRLEETISWTCTVARPKEPRPSDTAIQRALPLV